MSEWVDFGELLRPPYSLKEIEVFGLIKDGLFPHGRLTGQLLECPDYCHRYWREFERAGEIGNELLQEELSPSRRDELMAEGDSIKASLIEMTSDFPKDSADWDKPFLASWDYFEPPVSEEQARELVVMLDEGAAFRREDVERLIPSARSPERIRVDTSDRLNQISSPVEVKAAIEIHFKQEGDYWRIGTEPNYKNMKHCIGFEFIKFLLERPRELVPCDVLYHLGETTEDSVDRGRSKRASIPDSETSNDDFQNDFDEENASGWADGALEGQFRYEYGESAGMSSDPLLDREAVAAVRNALDDLEERCREETDPKEKKRLKEQIEKYEGYLQDQQRSFDSGGTPAADKARKNVQKAINRALNAVKRELPELIGHLNKSTIKTGFDCEYSPPDLATVRWITS